MDDCREGGISHEFQSKKKGIDLCVVVPFSTTHSSELDHAMLYFSIPVFYKMKESPKQVLLKSSEAEVTFFSEVSEALGSHLDIPLSSCVDFEIAASFLKCPP